jgi:hypothetical protein
MYSTPYPGRGAAIVDGVHASIIGYAYAVWNEACGHPTGQTNTWQVRRSWAAAGCVATGVGTVARMGLAPSRNVVRKDQCGGERQAGHGRERRVERTVAAAAQARDGTSSIDQQGQDGAHSRP